MTTKNEALYSRLSGIAGLTALVSTRIYPQVLPEDVTFPCIRHFGVSLNPTVAHDGDVNLDFVREQFDVYATTDLAVEAIVTQLRAALGGVTFTVGTLKIKARPAGEFELYDSIYEKYRRVVDFFLTLAPS